MPVALPHTEKIAQGASQKIQYKYKEVKFGDGYTQRAKDGINNKQQNWDIVWVNVNATEKATILTAFDTAKGVDYFTWQPPGESSSLKFIQTGDLSFAIKSGTLWDISVNLQQVFDI